MAKYNVRKRRKSSGKSFRYLPITAALFVVALLIGISAFFRVSDIVVTGASLYSKDEILEAAALDVGDNLLFFSEATTVDKISGKLAYAGDVQIDVKYPSTVEIKMNESVPVASIASGGSYWVIDTKGKIVEQTDFAGAADTIAVTGIELIEPEVGKTIESDNSTKVMYLIDILKSIHDNGAEDKITELDISSIANINFDYEGRFIVNFGQGGDSADKFRMLVKVISEKLEPTTEGTIEIDSEGGIHVIPA